MVSFVFPSAQQALDALILMAPSIPPELWWITASVLAILGVTAIAIFTTYIPDAILAFGLVAVLVVQGAAVSWKSAGLHLVQAVGCGLLVMAIHFAWKGKFRYDALGIRAAEWTALAVACFGILPLVYAWGVAVVLFPAFLLMLGLVNVRGLEVTFLPFLLIGLGVGLFYVRF